MPGCIWTLGQAGVSSVTGRYFCLIELMSGISHKDMESVVYHGAADAFGSAIDETLTLTFSNDVFFSGNDQSDSETYVFFEEAWRLGHNLSYMAWATCGNDLGRKEYWKETGTMA